MKFTSATIRSYTASELFLPSEVYRLILEQASDAILVVDRQTQRIVCGNERLREMAGLLGTDLFNSDVKNFFPHGDDPTHDFSLTTLEQPGLHEDVRLRRADDHYIFASVAVRHTESPNGSMAICILRDTTEKRLLERELVTKHVGLQQAHEQLQLLTKELEQRNTELSRLMEKMNSLAKRAAIAEVVASTAHSINNPLAALLSTIRQSEKQLAAIASDSLTQRLAHLFVRQRDAAEKIRAVVDELRQAIKASSTKVPKVAVDVVDQAELALELFGHRLARVQVNKHYEWLGQTLSRPEDIQHVFINLFDNALNAMNDTGLLEVHTWADANRAYVSITDDGSGIHPTVANRIFEPFVSNRENGTGLGLSFAQRIIHSCGGRIWADPERKQGARFVIEFPAHQFPEKVVEGENPC